MPVTNRDPRYDVDRAAREALRDTKPKPDLLKDGIAFNPGGFYIAVEPIEAKKQSAGGIVLASTTQEAEEYQIQVGRVLKVGPTAFDGKTESGIDLGKFTDQIQSPEQLIGKYVIFQKHTGNKLKLRKTGQSIIVLTLNELLGETNDPEAWLAYV